MCRMKETTECCHCSDCVQELPAGFLSAPRHYCTQRSAYVDPDDGCTFGVSGETAYGAPDIAVDLNGHEAVWGNRDPE